MAAGGAQRRAVGGVLVAKEKGPRPWQTHWQTHYTASVHVRVLPSGAHVRHLVVRKRSGLGGITWDVLQRIKDDLLGPEVLACELYPPADQVCYEAEMRHLWEIEPALVDRMPSLRTT